MNSTEKIAAVIEKAVREVYQRPDGVIPLHEPYFNGNEWRYVKDCLDTGWVSSVGSYVDKFEEMVSEYTGARYAVATVNGTAALHTALVVDGVTAGDEVLCPAFSFVATVNAVIYCRAFPVFLDSDPATLGMDVNKVRMFLQERCAKEKDGFTYNRHTGRKIKVCLPMHTYGYPVDMEPLVGLCREYNVSVIEDAAEALGSFYQDKHCGTMGRLGILSFNGNKTVTTGGGGIILTDDKHLAARAKLLTTTARRGHAWEYSHDEVGYNYRMPNLNAALGCAQLENLTGILNQKMHQANALRKKLETVDGVRAVPRSVGRVNSWFNIVEVGQENRIEVLKALNERGISARAAWVPLNKMKPYTLFEEFELQAATELYNSLICLPNGVVSHLT